MYPKGQKAYRQSRMGAQPKIKMTAKNQITSVCKPKKKHLLLFTNSSSIRSRLFANPRKSIFFSSRQRSHRMALPRIEGQLKLEPSDNKLVHITHEIRKTYGQNSKIEKFFNNVRQYIFRCSLLPLLYSPFTNVDTTSCVLVFEHPGPECSC